MPATNPDQPTSLDIEDHAALANYLRESRDVPTDGLTFQTLAGGVSNKTVLVNFPDGHGWVIKQALPKLRTKADWFSDPARVHREALGIRWLEKLLPAGSVAGFVFEDFDNHLLAMHAVPHPHENWKTMLLEGRRNPEHYKQFGRLLGMMHRASMERAGELAAVFGDRSFFESLRIEPYYLYTAEKIPEAATFLREVTEMSRTFRMALVHGDFSPKNILVHQDKLVLLDHEVIHWGDPAFDVGFALTHLICKSRHLDDQTSFFGALNFWKAYQESCGGWIERDANNQLAINAHLLACILARLDGRSPLEYLNETERESLRRYVLDRIRDVQNGIRRGISNNVEMMTMLLLVPGGADVTNRIT